MGLIIQVITVAIAMTVIGFTIKFFQSDFNWKGLVKTRKQRCFWVYTAIWIVFWSHVVANSIFFGDEETMILLLSSPLTLLVAYKSFHWIKAGEK